MPWGFCAPSPIYNLIATRFASVWAVPVLYNTGPRGWLKQWKPNLSCAHCQRTGFNPALYLGSGPMSLEHMKAAWQRNSSKPWGQRVAYFILKDVCVCLFHRPREEVTLSVSSSFLCWPSWQFREPYFPWLVLGKLNKSMLCLALFLLQTTCSDELCPETNIKGH